ncbi:MAG: GtrA family protein [Rikenellaceae bacterium]
MRERVERVNWRVAGLLSRLIDPLCLPILARWIGAESIRYFVCGVLNYIVLDASLYYIIYHYVVAEQFIPVSGVVISPHVASLVLVFPITFLTGFWLNRYVAFRVAERPVGWQMVRYALTVVGSIALSYAVLKTLVEVVGVWATPAKVLCSVSVALYSYLMARFFTFRG